MRKSGSISERTFKQAPAFAGATVIGVKIGEINAIFQHLNLRCIKPSPLPEQARFRIAHKKRDSRTLCVRLFKLEKTLRFDPVCPAFGSGRRIRPSCKLCGVHIDEIHNEAWLPAQSRDKLSHLPRKCVDRCNRALFQNMKNMLL